MRVCNFIEEGRFGGPQARITLVAEALKQFDIETHVAYSQYDADKFCSKLAQKKIPNSPLAITRLSKEKKTFIRYILYFFPDIYKLYSLFKKNKFDIVHINGSHQLKGPLAAKLAGIPVVWHLNDTNSPTIIHKFFSIIARYCARGFIVAGERVYHYYLQGTDLVNKPFCEIHAPVDVNFFDPLIVKSDQRLAAMKGVRILTVCNISPPKGLDYFVEMASLLNQVYGNLSFFVGGPVYSSQQKYFQILKADIESKQVKNITFLGRVDNVASALQGADIFVYSSLAEASPTVIWEAMAMGKAIVTTDVGSVSQYIEDGVSGFIVPIKDPVALSEKVEVLINNPALRERMGLEARVVAKNRLDVSSAAEKHATFYQQILSVCR
jgi:glycosyltransferase involved in cell wall biosynthesis